jgi:hypothetical protein
LDGSQLTLSLQGSSFYTIELNGISIQTEEANVVLALDKGLNTLKVFTSIPCQGVYEEQFARFDDPIVYPNPVVDVAEIYLGSGQEEVAIRIFSADGRLISSTTRTALDGKIELDFSSMSTGIYYLQYKGETIQGTSKVIKE